MAHIYAVAGMAGVSHDLRSAHDYGVDGQFDPVIIRGNRRVVSAKTQQSCHQPPNRRRCAAGASAPESLESTACNSCVMGRVLRVPMPEIILDQAEIISPVGEVEAT